MAEVIVEGTASARAGVLYAAPVRAQAWRGPLAGAEESASNSSVPSETGSSVTTCGTRDSVGGASPQGTPSTSVWESLFSM